MSKVNPFYRSLGELTSENGWLDCRILFLNEEPIAHDFAFKYLDTYYLGKTSFKEQLRRYGPGIVLRWKVLQDICTNGCKEIDFLSGTEKWKLGWSRTIRFHEEFKIFNGHLKSEIFFILGKLKH